MKKILCAAMLVGLGYYINKFITDKKNGEESPHPTEIHEVQGKYIARNEL